MNSQLIQGFLSKLPNAKQTGMGVGTRLSVSVFVLGILALGATGVAITAFNSSSVQFSQFNEKQVPALVTAGELSIKSTEMTINASELIDTDSEDIRAASFEKLRKSLNSLDRLVSEEGNVQAKTTDSMVRIRAGLKDFRKRMPDLNEFTGADIELARQSQEMLQKVFNVNTQLSQIMLPMIDKAYSELTTGGEKAANDSAAIVDTLLNKEIGVFQSLMALRNEVSLMSASISSFMLQQDKKLKREFQTSMAGASFRISILLDEMGENNPLDEEAVNSLKKLAEFADKARKFTKDATFFRDSDATRNYISDALELQKAIDATLRFNIEAKFSVMSLNAQDGANKNREIISQLLNTQMVDVRERLEQIATLRELTALAAKGVSRTDKEDIGAVQEQINAEMEKLSSLLESSNSEEMVIAKKKLATLVDPQKGLLGLRIQQLQTQLKVHNAIEHVHNDTKVINKAIHDLLETQQGQISDASKELNEQLQLSSYIMIAIGLISLTLVTFIGFFVVRKGIVSPLSKLIETTRSLADGDLNVNIEYQDRKDELGQLANALQVFHQNSIEKERVEREATQTRETADIERTRNEEAQAKAAAEIKSAVDVLARGLRELSDGNLTSQLSDPFVDSLEVIRLDFNDSLQKLSSAMSSVSENTSEIRNGAAELRKASHLLSTRTEQQASSIEETSTTLGYITQKVSDSADKAKMASSTVVEAKAVASEAAQVVSQSITAMSSIETASEQISSITAMIDEIAFQTNLLALNAGVEAARAGEAGQGFAVVAQEVRELAGRAAVAAKDIKDLISSSNEEIQNGVSLVKSTGESIEKMEQNVSVIDEHIEAIANTSEEQSNDIREVSTALSQLDQMTQQNAAMAEETNAATQSLADLSEKLTQLMAMFKVHDGMMNSNTAPSEDMKIAS